MTLLNRILFASAALLLGTTTADAGPLRRLLARPVCQPVPVYSMPAPVVQYHPQPAAFVPMPYQPLPTYQPRPLVQAVYQTAQAAASIPQAAVQGFGNLFAGPRTCGPNGCK